MQKSMIEEISIRSVLIAVIVIGGFGAVCGQTTSFIYQGRVTDGGTPANGNYDLQFKLFDSLANGTQIVATQTLNTVPVSSGVFSVTLDFGGSAFPGANRFLEISARLSGTSTFTLLSPRQQITSTLYAIRSLSAASADSIPANAVPAGSGNYVQNATTQQANSDFNISGNGTAAGTLSASTMNAELQFNLGGARILSNPGTGNLFAGVAAGSANTSGPRNTLLGFEAGLTQTTANGNTFVGYQAGKVNTGSLNTFVGERAGNVNNTGAGNSFFGNVAGSFSTTGSNNSFFGFAAGQNNQTGDFNSFFGSLAGQFNRSNFNSFFGSKAGLNTDTGHSNSFFGAAAGSANTSGFQNSFFGERAGSSVTNGEVNSFFGSASGFSTTMGVNNAFFGSFAGFDNVTGDHNTMIGNAADVAAGNLSHATAIGAGALVSTSNTIMLGRAAQDNVIAANRMTVRSIPLLASAATVCFNAAGDLLQCGASSLRLKRNVQPYRHGLDIVLRLRPISFNWKESGLADLGLGAEDVAQVAPSYVFTDEGGEANGVKYERLNVLLINAVKEQQEQIQRQQELIKQQQALGQRQQQEIAALKRLICKSQPRTKACR